MPRNRRISIVLLAGLSALSLGLTACSSSGAGGGDGASTSGGRSGSSNAASGKSYKIGVILPLTGPAADIGKDYQALAEVFKSVDPVGKALNSTYVFCDDKTSPDGAVACAQKLKQQDKVDIVYGPIIAGIQAAAATVFGDNIPSITSSPDVYPASNTPVFSASGNSHGFTTATLQFAKDHGWQRVAILATSDATGQTAIDDINDANKTIGLDISVERMGPTDTDATPELNRLLQKKPQYIWLASTGASVGVGLKGLKQLGANIPTALIWSNTTNSFLAAAKDSFPSQTYFAMAPAWLPDTLTDKTRADQIKAFQAAYKDKTGEPISFVVQGGYDGFQLLFDALSKVSSNVAKVKSYIESLRSFQGLNWALSYSPTKHSGGDEKSYVMMQYTASSNTWTLGS
jgi:branched-chain amino acid transport system substrate-binding protein